MMEFHISRASRDKYNFDQLLFSTDGSMIFANFQAARLFAEKINAQREDKNDPHTYISPGEMNALGLIDELFNVIINEFYLAYGADTGSLLYQELKSKIGSKRLDATLTRFIELFPTTPVYTKEMSPSQYLAGQQAGVSNAEIVLQGIFMLWLTNVNPAANPFSELFSDSDLDETTAYSQLISGIQVFFNNQPPFGPEHQDLVSMLRTPAIMVPQSLSGQLEYIRDHWSNLIGKYLYKLLGCLDMIKEEQKIFFGGSGPSFVPDYSDGTCELSEEERFSPDSDWMPNVIMMAKNSFVWLDQLSKQYQRPIQTLDQIPDETLDEMARWGFTGLWLIGLWERSEASRTIKQMCGNPDAVSSAYSLSRYQIAERLGGDSAYQNLSYRAGQRGIRLASDMVPNHMGIDSDWVYDHPEWFIGQDYSPFPSYTYLGPDLSQNPNVSINLEDHYYSRSDAAVVFKRYDRRSGRESYIYHGNDGTSMPWNDTAQLNYLLPEVREAVIQTILSVARKFPIIRFDAAMTLTKKHYQRLWFPQPGTGGDIPSRAEHAMSKEAFDQAMPEEFWREVVERIASEVPDTLLLAEAFWLMEGYFVRSLGMHRVYNSAFMHMLRDEENDKYRQLIKNTLVYDPQILKRYVNFMNNPDEKTAVEQYGKGDKYFGICALMATLPGLPMFGHGQIEGYAEKYGMEYYRPYWDENPDPHLVERHQRDIFPILHRRRIFANVENFLLYDFNTTSGYVDENVFAYSNSSGKQHALVVHHNHFGSTAGWIKTSNPSMVKGADGTYLVSRDLASGLGLQGDSSSFVIFRDYIQKLEYIRSVQEIRERGMYFSLNAYEHQVFMDFREVQGREYEELNAYLNGRGVPSLEAAKYELVLAPIVYPLQRVFTGDNLSELTRLWKLSSEDGSPSQKFQGTLAYLQEASYAASRIYGLGECIPLQSLPDFERRITAVFGLENNAALTPRPGSKRSLPFVDELTKQLKEDPKRSHVLLVWVLLSSLNAENTDPSCTAFARRILDETPVSNLITDAFRQLGFNDSEAQEATLTVKWLLSNSGWTDTLSELDTAQVLEAWLSDRSLRESVGINLHNDILWFNQEKFETMLWYMRTAAIIHNAYQDDMTLAEQIEAMLAMEPMFAAFEEALASSEFQLDKLRASLSAD